MKATRETGSFFFVVERLECTAWAYTRRVACNRADSLIMTVVSFAQAGMRHVMQKAAL